MLDVGMIYWFLLAGMLTSAICAAIFTFKKQLKFMLIALTVTCLLIAVFAGLLQSHAHAIKLAQEQAAAHNAMQSADEED